MPAPEIQHATEAAQPTPEAAADSETAAVPAMSWWRKGILGLFFAFFVYVLMTQAQAQAVRESDKHLLLHLVSVVSLLAIPFLLSFFPLYAALRGLRVYEEFVEGAKEGFQMVVRLIPFLVAMLVAIGMFRAAGGIDLLTQALAPLLRWVQFPPELVPLVLMRPLSGSASTGIFADLVKNLGPDHLVTRMAASIMGSTETTFYVIAVYFGAVAVRRTRHAVPCGLIADFTGVMASVIICRLLFRG